MFEIINEFLKNKICITSWDCKKFTVFYGDFNEGKIENFIIYLGPISTHTHTPSLLVTKKYD